MVLHRVRFHVRLQCFLITGVVAAATACQSAEDRIGVVTLNIEIPGEKPDSVLCGGHRAGSCAQCPQGHGPTWCNADCRWDQKRNVCVDVMDTAGQAKAIALKVRCGEHAADAAARIATGRETSIKSIADLTMLALEIQEAISAHAPDYAAPDVTTQREERMLLSVSSFVEQAQRSSGRGDFKTAVADLLWARLTGFDASVLDPHLRSTLEQSVNRWREMITDGSGDLGELFDALELEDSGVENAEVDRKQLKKVYRELSIMYHPDKNPASGSMFNRVRDAYEILSDPVKTMLYDTGGPDLVKKYEAESHEVEHGDHLEKKVTLELEEVYAGAIHKVSVYRRVVCRSCRLRPHLPRCAKCKACPGTVEYRRRMIDSYRYYQEQVEVPSKDKCIQRSETIDVIIEKGMSSGDTIVHANRASQQPKQVAGNILVNIEVKTHRIFRRIGSDLLVTLKISLFDALMGFERELVHLDGHVVKFGMKRGTVLRPGAGFEIAGEGMPLREDPTQFGRLLVKFELDFPSMVPEHVQDQLGSALLELQPQAKNPIDRIDYQTSHGSNLYRSEL